MSNANSDIDIDLIMRELSMNEGHNIFSSESDFQFSMAWAIKERYPDYDIRLEKVFDKDPNKHFDIVVYTGDGIIPIELKYCTKSLPADFVGDVFLRDHGAEDLRRYDFIKDVQRIESLRSYLDGDLGTSFICGYAVFLTNSSPYWTGKRDYSRCIDEAFRIHEEKKTFGGRTMMWSDAASKGTVKGRERPLHTKQYDIVWRDYLDYPKFRYLSVRIQ